MRAFLRRGLVGLSVAAAAGCVTEGPDRGKFKNPFAAEQPAPPFGPAGSAPVATRVDTIGTGIVAANKADFQGTKPVFYTLGLKDPMIFHRSDGVVISEGLVEKCTTDEELAAVLCHELGRFAARYAERTPGRSADTDLPPAPALTRDVVGGGGGPDRTREAEAALMSRGNPRASGARRPAPDAKTLATNFYVRAGHKAEDFDRVADLVKTAEENAADREVMKGR
ncbi:MAG TPA: M48 family metalloprotease [Gemmataceae bacterium]|jgi:hypothetical protein|nr:M48 family metalloprotease [Gemmataceae bacterium]